MQCKAFCSADSYQITSLYQFLKEADRVPQRFTNVIYTPLNEGHVFFFSYGAIVFWELSDDEIKKQMKELKKFEVERISKITEDNYFIVKADKTKIYQNEISLSDDDGIMEKLAISYALAQSMKLSVFEERVEHTIKETEHIPASLAKTGKITLSGKEIAKKMGKLFIERSSINLHSDILDTPDFFWDNPELEPLHRMTAKDQDLKQRVEILNKRLNLINELFQILSDVFNNRHSSLLEIIIIILIGTEIALTLGFKFI